MGTKECEERLCDLLAAPPAKGLVGEGRLRRKLVPGLINCRMRRHLPRGALVEEIAELDPELLRDRVEGYERGHLAAVLYPTEIATRDPHLLSQYGGRDAVHGP